MYKQALRIDYQKMHARWKKCIQLKYEKPHNPFLTLDSSEEQFTANRTEKLLDGESKTLIRTHAQDLGNNLDTRKKNNLFSL